MEMKVVSEAVKEEIKYSEQVRNLTAEIEARFGQRVEVKDAAEAENEKADTDIEETEIENTDAEIKKETDKIHAAITKGINILEDKVKKDIEFAIKSYNAKLEKLKEFTDSMLESGASFEETIDNAMNILNEKIAKITKSTESANVVSKNIDKYPQEFLTKYQQIRT